MWPLPLLWAPLSLYNCVFLSSVIPWAWAREGPPGSAPHYCMKPFWLFTLMTSLLWESVYVFCQVTLRKNTSDDNFLTDQSLWCVSGVCVFSSDFSVQNIPHNIHIVSLLYGESVSVLSSDSSVQNFSDNINTDMV